MGGVRQTEEEREGVGEKNQSGVVSFLFFFFKKKKKRLKKLFPGKSSSTNRRLVPALKHLQENVFPSLHSCGFSGVTKVSGGEGDVLQMY